MNELIGKALTVKEALNNSKYRLPYYQREYTWAKQHVRDLLDDLTSRFSSEYDENDQPEKVGNYRSYFLGPIVTGKADGASFLVDGQQRFTTLTLLLVSLHHLSEGKQGAHNLESLIFSEYLGKKTFNLDVPERNDVMRALLKGESYDSANQSASVRKIHARYKDIVEYLSEELKGRKLIYFIYWLIERVVLVEIITPGQDMALEVFEAMNDRGMRLSNTDMLKSYLLSKIQDQQQIKDTNSFWRERITKLSDLYKNAESDFLRVWLRSKYAKNIRTKKGASSADFNMIGKAYHRWVRDNNDTIGLDKAEEYKRFIDRDFAMLSSRWMQIVRASWNLTDGLDNVFYNDAIGIHIQDLPIMATITPDDDDSTFALKAQLVAGYLNIFVARRIVNWKNYGYSTIVSNMFNLAKDIRNLDPDSLRDTLQQRVSDLPSLDRVKYFSLGHRNRRRVRYLLSRMTAWIEQSCGMENRFAEYVNRYRGDPYEVEHTWANKFDYYEDKFGMVDEGEINRHRHRLGALILLPKSINASLGAKPYPDKLPHYRAQNLLAASLHPDTYENNPRFLGFIDKTGLPFKSYPDDFTKDDIAERADLYRQICERVWDPDQLFAVEPDDKAT